MFLAVPLEEGSEAMTVGLLVFLCLLLSLACLRAAKDDGRTNSDEAVTEQKAILIVKEDALRAHLSTDSYNVFAVDEGVVWHVIFEPKDTEKDNVELEYQIFKVKGRLGGTIFEKGFRRLPRAQAPAKVEREKAIEIAKKDAAKSGVPLDHYDISAFDERQFWHIAFELKNKELAGGGPDYLIDKGTGEIVRKKIYQ